MVVCYGRNYGALSDKPHHFEVQHAHWAQPTRKKFQIHPCRVFFSCRRCCADDKWISEYALHEHFLVRHSGLKVAGGCYTLGGNQFKCVFLPLCTLVLVVLTIWAVATTTSAKHALDGDGDASDGAGDDDGLKRDDEKMKWLWIIVIICWLAFGALLGFCCCWQSCCDLHIRKTHPCSSLRCCLGQDWISYDRTANVWRQHETLCCGWKVRTRSCSLQLTGLKALVKMEIERPSYRNGSWLPGLGGSTYGAQNVMFGLYSCSHRLDSQSTPPSKPLRCQFCWNTRVTGPSAEETLSSSSSPRHDADVDRASLQDASTEINGQSESFSRVDPFTECRTGVTIRSDENPVPVPATTRQDAGRTPHVLVHPLAHPSHATREWKAKGMAEGKSDNFIVTIHRDPCQVVPVRDDHALTELHWIELLRQDRARYWSRRRTRPAPDNDPEKKGALLRLHVDVWLHAMTFLNADDLVDLCLASGFWASMLRLGRRSNRTAPSATPATGSAAETFVIGATSHSAFTLRGELLRRMICRGPAHNHGRHRDATFFDDAILRPLLPPEFAWPDDAVWTARALALPLYTSWCDALYVAV